MELKDDEREMIRKMAKLVVVGAFKYIMVSNLTLDQVDAEFERVSKEFDDFTPDKIGV
jgi:hypothetical protein